MNIFVQEGGRPIGGWRLIRQLAQSAQIFTCIHAQMNKTRFVKSQVGVLDVRLSRASLGIASINHDLAVSSATRASVIAFQEHQTISVLFDQLIF